MELKGFIEFVNESSDFSEESRHPYLDLLELGLLSISEIPRDLLIQLPHSMEVVIETDTDEGGTGYVMDRLIKIKAPNLVLDMESAQAEGYDITVPVWTEANQWDEDSLEDFLWDELDGPILRITASRKD